MVVKQHEQDEDKAELNSVKNMIMTVKPSKSSVHILHVSVFIFTFVLTGEA